MTIKDEPSNSGFHEGWFRMNFGQPELGEWTRFPDI